MATRLTLPAPHDFAFVPAVCSYGYYVLAPNRWDVATKRLHRPIRDHAGRVIRCVISYDRAACQVIVQCHRKVGRAHHAAIRRQVARMFHLDSDPGVFRSFHKRYAPARRSRFGRIFRSPTLFEDMVKTITGCNVAWANTMSMNRYLCEHVGPDGDFPLPGELARWHEADLKAKCKVGYRADRILRLARDVHEGQLDLSTLENPDLPGDELHAHLRAIHGFGEYAANNVMQLLGHYDRMAVDSEVIRHMKHAHGYRGSVWQITKRAHRHYDAYEPFQFLVYWHERWTAAHDGMPDAAGSL